MILMYNYIALTVIFSRVLIFKIFRDVGKKGKQRPSLGNIYGLNLTGIEPVNFSKLWFRRLSANISETNKQVDFTVFTLTKKSFISGMLFSACESDSQ